MYRAVKYNGLAIQHATRELKDNYELALESIKSNVNAFCHLSSDLQKDSNFILECI
jgi:hypothetical protein